MTLENNFPLAFVLQPREESFRFIYQRNERTQLDPKKVFVLKMFPFTLELMNASELNSGNMELSSYDGSQSPRSGGAMTPNSRNKRMRTSFKHHQLRTMKSYFAINQNPDAKDLKQLAQKTGLSKRVLQVTKLALPCSGRLIEHLPFSQVWFQNARAKWRRNVMRQDGSMQNSNCPPNITSYSTTDIHTPNSSESEVTPSHTHALEEMHNMSSCMELY